jgi:predicted nucleic acid-binding protein
MGRLKGAGVSFVVMRELRIRNAFTTDHHFEQAGYHPLLDR